MAHADIMYEAMLARDYRFDGKFYVGVKTTGVYCRPICPARPKRQNVEFFSRALEAERAGYRPCLRCRPESAPASPVWIGKSAVVQRALRFIAAGSLFETNEDEFAARFGMSARHLRRLFDEEIGQTPKQIASAQRLNFARTLAVETTLPMISIAANSGFSSLRRFNESFKERFKRSPSDVRKHSSAGAAETAITLDLPYRPPLDWTHMLGILRTHSIPGLESVTGETFERVAKIGNSLAFIQVAPKQGKPALSLRVTTKDTKLLFPIVRKVRALFDLDSDPLLIANSFEQEAILARCLRLSPGLRIARCWDGFETAVCAILGQVVSVAHATELCRSLLECCGSEFSHPVSGRKLFAFPSAAVLADADLSQIKTTNGKRETIRNFARAVRARQISLAEEQDPVEFRRTLTAIRGIGEWTADYISLRVLGDTDAFPQGDLVLKRALVRYPELDVESVRPWRAYAAIHLWNEEREIEKERQNETLASRASVASRKAQTGSGRRLLVGSSLGE